MDNNFSELKDYSTRLNSAISTVQQYAIDKLYTAISKRINSSSSIYLIGNGGSQANAHHIAGDYLKSFCVNNTQLRISCLGDNICYLTAVSNDLSYEESYKVLVGSLIQKNDFIIYLSGSGNSLNLVKCAQKAYSEEIEQASITAFNGGALSKIVDISIYIDVEDMEIAEDCQLIIFHHLKQRLLASIVEKNKQQSMTKYIKRTIEDLVS